MDLTEAGALGGDNKNTPTEIRTNARHKDSLRQQTMPQHYMNWDSLSVRTLMMSYLKY